MHCSALAWPATDGPIYVWCSVLASADQQPLLIMHACCCRIYSRATMNLTCMQAHPVVFCLILASQIYRASRVLCDRNAYPRR
jgi:hypothetical protein